MDLSELTALLQTAYIRDLTSMYHQHEAEGFEVSTEITVELSTGRFYTMDFAVRKAGKIIANDIAASDSAYSSPIVTSYNGMEVAIGQVSWGAMWFVTAPVVQDAGPLQAWIDTWHNFDQAPARYTPEPAWLGIIHDATITPDGIVVDFGTAPPAAFVELLDLFVLAGVHELKIEGALSP